MEKIALEFDTLLERAFNEGATDIHITINQQSQQIVQRTHKRKQSKIEVSSVQKIYQYIVYLSGLELQKSSIPVSTMFHYCIRDVELFIRVSVLNVKHQIHVALRILNQKQINSLASCGFKSSEIEVIKRFTTSRSGLLVFAGTTGAGKSTSMFTLLSELSQQMIITLESPVEHYFEGLIQFDIAQKQYHEYVKQILRHDPDIVVFGEVRDAHDLSACLHCVLTGHRVITTFHASSVAMAYERLKHLNSSHLPLDSMVHTIVYQHLKIENGVTSLEVDIQAYDTKTS